VIVAGSATGLRYASNQGLKETFYKTAHELGSWFIPQSSDFNVIAGVGILLVQAAGVALSLRSALRNEWSTLHVSTLLTGTFSIAYVAAIILASVLSSNCCVGGRFEAPLFPVFVLGATFSIFLLTEAAARFFSNGNLMLKAATALFVLLGASVSLSRSLTHADIFLSTGPKGYSQARYREPDWIEYAKTMPPGIAIFSDHPGALYLYTGLRASYTPWSRAYASSVKFDNGLSAFGRVVATTPRVFIVWFKEDVPNYLFDLSALQTVLSLKLLADFPHVSVYEASTKPIDGPSPPNPSK
jgi:hypothetical protein